MSAKAIQPPILWRQRPPYPEPPAGYRLAIYRSQAARQAARTWGVPPAHIGQCTYALWVPTEDWPVDAPIRRDAAAWLAAGGQAAIEISRRDYPFGRERICAYALARACPIPEEYTSRAADLHDFLSAARSAGGQS